MIMIITMNNDDDNGHRIHLLSSRNTFGSEQLSQMHSMNNVPN